MRSLAAALKDFGTPQFAAAEPFAASFDLPGGFDLPPSDLPVFPDVMETAPVDVETLVADAVAQAEAALAERMTEEHGEALRVEREGHALEMTELQARFAAEAANAIQAGITEMESRVVELTGAVTARILGLVLTEDLRTRSIDRLTTIIRDAMTDDDAIRIRIRGSLPLYEDVKARLPEHAGQFDFAESPDFDLSVTIDDSVFETRLAEWSAALAETLA